MKNIIILLLMYCLSGCIAKSPSIFTGPSTPDNATRDWIYGKWLTVTVSDTIVEYHNRIKKSDPEKHILHFTRQGEMRRYSPDTGWRKMRLEFRVEGRSVMMRPHSEEEFRPLCQLLEHDQLELLVPRGRYTYVKLNEKVVLEELAMEGVPEIENSSEPL